LFQAVQDAGFLQVETGEFTRDWDLQKGVLRWCVPPDTNKWGNELLVSAVGEKTVHSYGFKSLPKGWTPVKDSKFTDRIDRIAYGNGKFVAVGSYQDKDGSWPGEMAYSSDGVTWTRAADSKLESTISSIGYGGGKFVSGGGGSVKMAFYSTDGVTWTAAGGPIISAGSTGGTAYAGNIAYGGGIFLAAGGLQGPNRSWWRDKMSYSKDGVTWTPIEDSTILSFGVNGIAYGVDRFVAVGKNGNRNERGEIAYSRDGVTWTRAADTKFGEQGIVSIVYAGDKFVAGGDKFQDKDGNWHGKMAYSTDGVTWTAVEDSALSNGVNCIAYGAGRFVATDYDCNMAYSANGVTWTKVGRFPFGISAIAYGGGRFVAVGWGGKIVYSDKLE